MKGPSARPARRRIGWFLALAVAVAGLGLTACDLAGPQVATSSLPIGTWNRAYSATLHATGGSNPYRWSASGLPAGLHLGSGKISGTPTAFGTFSVRLAVVDGAGRRAVRSVVLLINNADQAAAIELVNQDRSGLGLSPYPEGADIATSAQAWAVHLAQIGALAHDLPATNWKPGCARQYGENVGTGLSLAAIEAAFMASSHHRPQIVSSTFTQIGIGVARTGNSYFVVQRFTVGC